MDEGQGLPDLWPSGALAGDATITIDGTDARKLTYSATVVRHGFEVLDMSGIILNEVRLVLG